jgi:hypothetical protein
MASAGTQSTRSNQMAFQASYAGLLKQQPASRTAAHQPNSEVFQQTAKDLRTAPRLYHPLPECSRLIERGRTGSGSQTAVVRAHSRASALSVTPGNSRRGSTAAANCRYDRRRLAAASASVTTNITGACKHERGRASDMQTTAAMPHRVALARTPTFQSGSAAGPKKALRRLEWY